MLIDTHAHLDFFEDSDKIIKNAMDNDVKKFIVPGVEPDNFDKIIKLSNKYENVYFALGVHPSEVSKFNKDTINKITKFKNDKKMVALGEIGLDYFYDKDTQDEQKRVFRTQLEIALALDLPVIVHDRDAHLDTFQILEEYNVKHVLMHCYSGSLEFAKNIIKKGWMIGIGGVVTFKNAKKLKEVVKNIPLENIVLETDCPYLAPHPFRGEQNEPKYIPFIAKEIANIKDIPLSEVHEITTKNAINFFSLDE